MCAAYPPTSIRIATLPMRNFRETGKKARKIIPSSRARTARRRTRVENRADTVRGAVYLPYMVHEAFPPSRPPSREEMPHGDGRNGNGADPDRAMPHGTERNTPEKVRRTENPPDHDGLRRIFRIAAEARLADLTATEIIPDIDSFPPLNRHDIAILLAERGDADTVFGHLNGEFAHIRQYDLAETLIRTNQAGVLAAHLPDFKEDSLDIHTAGALKDAGYGTAVTDNPDTFLANPDDLKLVAEHGYDALIDSFSHISRNDIALRLAGSGDGALVFRHLNTVFKEVSRQELAETLIRNGYADTVLDHIDRFEKGSLSIAVAGDLKKAFLLRHGDGFERFIKKHRDVFAVGQGDLKYLAEHGYDLAA